MVIYPGVFLLFSTIIYPMVAEVLTQSFVIRLKKMEQLIQNQKNATEELKNVIEEQKQLIEYQERMLQAFKSGVHFTVKMSYGMTFLLGEVIKFDQAVVNVGGGYIDDTSNADYGKFIAPQNGTYQFSANFHNENKRMGGDLMKNGVLITGNSNGANGAASLTSVLDLEQGDQVYLQRPSWVGDDAEYSHFFTSFSGVLIRAEF